MGYFNDINNYKKPETCPKCNYAIEPIFGNVAYNFLSKERRRVEYRIIFQCPREACAELFISYYYLLNNENGRPTSVYEGSFPSNFKPEVFEDSINNISPLFVEIYNQAKEAEDRGLSQICGLGYRKALEFLIKDYLVLQNPGKEEEIKNNHRFAHLIREYVTNDKVRAMAERASWLGNDHAHYTKKWVDRDISDLKSLISASIYWISAEMLYDRYVLEMN